MFKKLISVLGILVLWTAPAFAKRVALVIGNSAYEHTVFLPNPANDARLMAGKLNGLGFEVVEGIDQNYREMRQSILEFAKKAYGANIALLFYAGHGMQIAGQNLMVPIDAKIEDEASLDFETITVDFVMRQMSKDVKVQMVFLDACRDNPLARSLARRMGPSRSTTVGSGLAEIKIVDTGAEGAVIAFATSPGDVALDGEGENSPFTAALARHIDAPDVSIQTVMTRVTGDVFEETDKRQRPWVNASLIGELFLNKQSNVSTSKVLPADDVPTTQISPETTISSVDAATRSTIAWEREKLVWETVKSNNTVADYESYLSAYPNGTFANFANNSIGRLKNYPQVAAVGSSPKTGAVKPQPGLKKTLPNPQNAVAGNQETEASLGWNRTKRREVQTRLNLSGHNVGRSDGAFGPKTRAGISAWQTTNGIAATGYFTAAQYVLLITQTDSQYAAYIAEVKRKQNAARASRSAANKRRTNSTTAQHRATGNQNMHNNSGSSVNPAGAAFIGGVVGGIIGGAIGR